jgi:hypothetical protein
VANGSIRLGHRLGHLGAPSTRESESDCFHFSDRLAGLDRLADRSAAHQPLNFRANRQKSLFKPGHYLALWLAVNSGLCLILTKTGSR